MLKHNWIFKNVYLFLVDGYFNIISYQWAANGLQRSKWNGIWRRSLNRTAASMYRNRSHNITVGKHTPLSVKIKAYYFSVFPFIKTLSVYFMRNVNIPVCQTYCTQTYVLAAKNSQCTGIKKKQIMSDVSAIQMKNTEKACNK